MDALTEQHGFAGVLIAVEGIDGSGKTTQLRLLQKWLTAEGHRAAFTEWNSSALVRNATKVGKKKNLLTPTTFSLIHATDFADRLFYDIIPPLKAGMMVLADRYAYTAFGRDIARGVSPDWVQNLYSFAIKPDLVFYFKVSIDLSIDRLMSGRSKIKFYEAGMDVTQIRDPIDSFRHFQKRVLEEYDRMAKPSGFVVIDAARSIDDQQRNVRRIVSQLISQRARKNTHGS